ncbi:MAG: ABC transporter substrate-binding protein, partial [Treponema sp.]|nr:ABC transporter substrate-binding protein [Treponema sp.]
EEVKQAAESIVNRVDGVYLTTDNTVFSAIPALIAVFNKAKKPIYSADVTGAMSGGIAIASGFNYYKAGRATGDIIKEIVIDGKKPAQIPVKFMTKPSDKDLLLDLDVLTECGITIPQSYINQANMIFENGHLTNK